MVANQEWQQCKYCRHEQPGGHDVCCPLVGPIGSLSERKIRFWNLGWYDGQYKDWPDADLEMDPFITRHSAYKLGWRIGEWDMETSVEQAVELNSGYMSDEEYPKLIF